MTNDAFHNQLREDKEEQQQMQAEQWAEQSHQWQMGYNAGIKAKESMERELYEGLVELHRESYGYNTQSANARLKAQELIKKYEDSLK